jgi:branched-chain amino acid aminotransferase
LVTPPVTASLLESVTRDTLMVLGRDLGLTVEVRDADRTELYSADESFLCNSFQEVRPITAVDGIQVGAGAVGPVTTQLWDTYEQVVRDGNSGYLSWLTPVTIGVPIGQARD